MMRVLQLMAGAGEGGAETFFTRLALGFQSAGVQQHIILRPDVRRGAVLRDAGVALSPAPFGGILDWSTGGIVSRAIEELSPDIVLSWMNRATKFCPPRNEGQRFVHIGTPRGYYHPKYYRACDHLIVTTDDLVQFYLDRGWAEDRITAIPNFAPDFRAAALSRAAHDTPDDAPLLLALGRLHRNKAFDVLIDALAELPGHYLWLGGVGPLEEALRAQADRVGVADRIRFLGWVADTAPLFAASDVFVCSSRHEPFGNIIIEAWLNETPIVAARSEGPGALIADDEDGLITPLDDAAAMAGAIRRITGDKSLAIRLADKGRARYEAGFTEAEVVARYRDLFERLVA
jgi:glycosyltransferase involved in cell wall biosynthesis